MIRTSPNLPPQYKSCASVGTVGFQRLLACHNAFPKMYIRPTDMLHAVGVMLIPKFRIDPDRTGLQVPGLGLSHFAALRNP